MIDVTNIRLLSYLKISHPDASPRDCDSAPCCARVSRPRTALLCAGLLTPHRFLLCAGLLTPHHALTAGLPCMPQRRATGDLPVKTRGSVRRPATTEYKTRGSVRRPATTEYKTRGSVRRPATTEYSTARTQAMKDATHIRLPHPNPTRQRGIAPARRLPGRPIARATGRNPT